jgi:hypothetical protein
MAAHVNTFVAIVYVLQTKTADLAKNCHVLALLLIGQIGERFLSVNTASENHERIVTY